MSLDSVIEYYEKCHRDFVDFWRIDENLGFHLGFYDKHHKDHNEAVVNMNRVMAEIVGIKRGEKVLDIGCGIGGSLIWLAENFEIKGVGINIVKKQIEIAKQLVREYRLDSKIKFYLRNFYDTGFSQDSFDIVWGLESVCYAEDKKALLREISRILKRNGRLIITEAFKKENISKKDQINLREKWLKNWAVPTIVKRAEFLKYLKELDFKDIKFFNITKNVEPSLRQLYLASLYAYPIIRSLELFGLREEIRRKNVLGSYYQYKFLKRGLWEYVIIYASK